MFDRLETLAATLFVASLLFITTEPAAAQRRAMPPGVMDGPTVTLDGGLGVGLPVGDLGDAFDPGGAGDLGVGVRLNPRISLRLDGGAEFLSLEEEVPSFAGTASDLTLWHYGATVGLDLVPPMRTPFRVTALLGGGGTTLDFRDADRTETYPSVNGGLRFGYQVDENVKVFADGRARLAITDEEDIGTDDVWSIPLTAGVEVAVP